MYRLPGGVGIRRGTLALGSVMVAGGVLAASAFGVSDVGCDTASVASIVESSAFTPYEERLTHDHPGLINPLGLQERSAPAFAPTRLDDMDVALSITDPRGSSTYYSAEAIGPAVAVDQFYASGGVLLLTEANDPGAGDYVLALKELLGDRVTIVHVGKFDAALTWGDPMANGVRPHNLIWVDRGTNFTLVASRAPERLLSMARGMVC